MELPPSKVGVKRDQRDDVVDIIDEITPPETKALKFAFAEMDGDDEERTEYDSDESVQQITNEKEESNETSTMSKSGPTGPRIPFYFKDGWNPSRVAEWLICFAQDALLDIEDDDDEDLSDKYKVFAPTLPGCPWMIFVETINQKESRRKRSRLLTQTGLNLRIGGFREQVGTCVRVANCRKGGNAWRVFRPPEDNLQVIVGTLINEINDEMVFQSDFDVLPWQFYNFCYKVTWKAQWDFCSAAAPCALRDRGRFAKCLHKKYDIMPLSAAAMSVWFQRPATVALQTEDDLIAHTQSNIRKWFKNTQFCHTAARDDLQWKPWFFTKNFGETKYCNDVTIGERLAKLKKRHSDRAASRYTMPLAWGKRESMDST